MFRVPALAIAQVDLRIVLFALLIAAGAALASLQILARARDCEGSRRSAWLLLAGAGAAVGIWATHFLAIRAYTWDFATTYSVAGIAAALLVAMIATTAGLALAVPEGRWQAAAGGALIGLGLVLTHTVGLKAIEAPATLLHNVPVAIILNALAVALCCAAMIAHREPGRRWMSCSLGGCSWAIPAVTCGVLWPIFLSAMWQSGFSSDILFLAARNRANHFDPRTCRRSIPRLTKWN